MKRHATLSENAIASLEQAIAAAWGDPEPMSLAPSVPGGESGSAAAGEAEVFPPESPSDWPSRLAGLMYRPAAIFAETLDADWSVTAGLVDPSGSLLLRAVAVPQGHPPLMPASVTVANDPAHSMAAYALQASEVIVTANLAAERRFTDVFLENLRVVSAMAIPLYVHAKPFGTMALCRTRGQEFTRASIRSGLAVRDSLASLIAELETIRQQSAGSNADGKPHGAAIGEQRSSRRHPYFYYQKIAPVFDDRPPRESDFFEVPCKDLSSGGFSFFLESRPAFDRLVLGVGRNYTSTYILAKVVRVAQVCRNQRSGYLVGCRFLKRVNLCSV